jgi:hypothetical protein
MAPDKTKKMKTVKQKIEKLNKIPCGVSKRKGKEQAYFNC